MAATRFSEASKSKYIVFDEAHFFVEDSLFNAKTDLLLKSVLDASPDAVWIFLSATLDGSEELLLAAADKIQPNNCIDANLNTVKFWTCSVDRTISRLSGQVKK